MLRYEVILHGTGEVGGGGGAPHNDLRGELSSMLGY